MLNGTLYNKLVAVFRTVKVTNKGIYPRKVFKTSKDNKRYLSWSGGEQYLVNCPMCRDTKFNLEFNCYYGTRLDNKLVLDCAKCWRCDAQPPGLYEKLFASFGTPGGVTPLSMFAAPAVPPAETAVLTPYDLKRWPAKWEYVPMSKWPPVSALHYYILDRGVNLHEAEEWPIAAIRIKYTRSSELALFFPFVDYIGDKLEMVGWQVRYIEDKEWRKDRPKYMMPRHFAKNAFMYNWYRVNDKASEHAHIVLCEGVFDAFAIGFDAVALLGKTVSAANFDKLVAYPGTIYVMLDHDAKAEAQALVDKLRKAGKENTIYLPTEADGQTFKDPGEMTRKQIKQAKSAARLQYDRIQCEAEERADRELEERQLASRVAWQKDREEQLQRSR